MGDQHNGEQNNGGDRPGLERAHNPLAPGSTPGPAISNGEAAAHNADTVKLPPLVQAAGGVTSPAFTAPGEGVAVPVREPLGGEAGRNLDVRFNGETDNRGTIGVIDTEAIRGKWRYALCGDSRNVGTGTAAPLDCTAAQRELDAAVADLRADKEGRQAKRERVRLAREAVEACEAAQRERLRAAEEAVAADESVARPVRRRSKAAVAVSWSWNLTSVSATACVAYYLLAIWWGWGGAAAVQPPVPRSARVLDALYRRGHVPPEAEGAARKALIEDGVGDPEGGGR